jgi:hypothetical protein
VPGKRKWPGNYIPQYFYGRITKQPQTKSHLRPRPKHINPARRIDMPKGQYTRKPLKERFEEKVMPEPNTGCWLWMGKVCTNGYGEFWPKPDVAEQAHRTAWILYVGPIPEGMNVLHKCDTRSCVNPLHLFLGTQKDNMQDCVKKGRFRGGPNANTDHRPSPLTESQVLAIRADTRPKRLIAREYGIDPKTVRNIKDQVHFRHLFSQKERA